jgi:NADH-quinone oxidoreductase subunit N
MLIALAAAPYLAGAGMGPSAGAGPDGVAALLFYLVAYGVMTVGAFAVVSYLSTRERPLENVDDLAGLSKSHPGIALIMAIFLFSLIGIPLTAGFTGKFLVFFGALAVEREHMPLFTILAFLGVVNAAIGGWYYLRMVAVMYLRGGIRPIAVPPNRPALVTLGLCVLLTVGLSIPPASNWLLEATRDIAGQRTQPPALLGQAAGLP